MRCDDTKVWRWPDCRDAAISLAECCLGEAQFRTAFTRFTTLCRTMPAAARPDGLDHVLRAIGAGISKLMQMSGADLVAIYYRYKGAAEVVPTPRVKCK